MSEPKIEIIPLRRSVRSDGPTTLDVLIRITAPTPEVHFVRPVINLGLVLDHSGSMAGAKKMAYACEAAAFAVQQLLPTDRVSVTVFDEVVDTIAASALVTEKESLLRRIREIAPRGSTNLHAGWKEGTEQVAGNLVWDGLNRVIVLSDGLANVGVTDPNVIAGEARALAANGVSTTTMGLGDDYNEDLMQAVGEAGDGNYYYIESPIQLTDIFQTEMKGLMANTGRKVSLGIEPLAGAAVGEVLNELERNSFGRLMLPNLVVGMPIHVVVRLKVPATSREAEVCRFRLAWDDPKGAGRCTSYAALAVGSCPSSVWEALEPDPRVSEQVAILMAARAKKEAIAAYDRGDFEATRAFVAEADLCMMDLALSPLVDDERKEIAKLAADLNQGKGAKFRKRSAWQVFQKKQGRGS